MPLESFHPTVREWFSARFESATEPQERGWPLIRSGAHTLIAAPTGSGKTLAAFLTAIDSLLRRGADLPDETLVLYVSPLKALGNDVQKNLSGPLGEIREMDDSLPDVRILVRSGDTPQKDRAAMKRRPPHILVTTPESLYILLTSDGGRAILGTVRTVIVDEIHAVAGSKRGSHLALSLERLEALCGADLQRIGLSATQKPLSDMGRFLVGAGRDCELVDAGHLRELDLAIEVPDSPLETVCSHEVWDEIYERMAELIQEHRTTLVFVNTRKLSERIGARLVERLGADNVASHHGSLAKDRRLDAEERLKRGELRALVATASLELGIDVGDVDLVIQVGTTASIATFLQRVGRAGHALGRVPRGRLFPLTRDELVTSIATLRAVRRGELDRTPQPRAPLDILAQQIVADCVPGEWREEELFALCRRAWPYRDLSREDFEQVLALHSDGRHALLHRDGVGGRVMATKRARMTAISGGGAIPDSADYKVVEEPAGTPVGSLNEDFAIESSVGDVFQLGTTSWQILKVEPGTVRVVNAQGAPPTLPFWFGEGPARTRELSAEISLLREEQPTASELAEPDGVPEAAAVQVADYLDLGAKELGELPTQRCLVLERFFDETGGMQLVLHSPFGGRINRALGLALRKRFCVGFGFELQAAANEEAVILSLGLQQSFPLEEVFDYLHPTTARKVLIKALIPAPMFQARWRWNVTRSLLVPRMRGGKRTPPPLLRMRADDLMAQAFPDLAACPETLTDEIRIPMEHPVVRQTIEDCLHEAMDVDGFLEVLAGLRDGSIRRVALDRPEPSVLAQGILNSQAYTFLDDAPLEERRTQAVARRRVLTPTTADSLGALDAAAVERVKGEAWPDPESAEEVHEALLWMGYVTAREAAPWAAWIDELAAAGRVVLEDGPEGGRWFAVEATRDPLAVLRGRMEAVGPIASDDPLMIQLETEGRVLRVRHEGATLWCDRRLLARIHRYTLDRLRREIQPVTPAEFLRFLACWQHVDPGYKLDGPGGVAQVLRQLAGFDVPAAAWEKHVLPARVRGYRPEWLDRMTLSGEIAWGRLWGGGASALRTTPLCLVPREDIEQWESLAGPASVEDLRAEAVEIREALLKRGAAFAQELRRATRLLPAQVDVGLGELVSHGAVTCDSFAGLRRLVVPPSRRRNTLSRTPSAGRWSLFRRDDDAGEISDDTVEFVARRLLGRTGVVFRRTLTREKIPVPWWRMLRALRRMEMQGHVRGGRFVDRFAGEQYALPEAVRLLRDLRKAGERPAVSVAAGDPLNFRGILTPDERVPPATRREVLVG